MRAVAYSVRPFEEEIFRKVNQDKHEILYVADALGPDTVKYAAGMEAVIVFTNDDVSAAVVAQLAERGIRHIATRSTGMDHIDKVACASYHIEISNVPSYSPEAIAEHAVAMAFALNRQLIRSDRHSHHFDFRNNGLIGFNFSGKTVGLIGMGNTGRAVARIFNGMGCRVIAFDVQTRDGFTDVEFVSMATLLSSADIISLHVPLNPATQYLVNAETIGQMKDGVMLINTSRGGLINTVEVLEGLVSGKIGYLGLDVYEYEHGLFFEDHRSDPLKDELLLELMKQKNVLITPHQAYLTREALQEIAARTISNLDASSL